MASPAASPAAPAKRPPAGAAARLAVLVVAGSASALGAWLGGWWVPFLVGLAVGVISAAGARLPRPVPRGSVLTAAAGAILGWAVPLWAMALAGLPVGGTARTIAALAGLPPYAALAVTVVLLLAALQVLAGAWLARAVIPVKAAAAAGKGTREPGEPPEEHIGQALGSADDRLRLEVLKPLWTSPGLSGRPHCASGTSRQADATKRSKTCAGQPCTSRRCGKTPRRQARPATGCCCGPGISAS